MKKKHYSIPDICICDMTLTYTILDDSSFVDEVPDYEDWLN